MKVVAIVGSRSKEVFKKLVKRARKARIYALVRDDILLEETKGISGILFLSKEEVSLIEREKFNPKEMLPFLRQDDFLLLIGFSKGFYPKILADNEGILPDERFLLARVGKGPENVRKVSMEKIWEFLMKRVPEYPALLDCGLCGFRSCDEYLREAIDGKEVKCVSSHTFASVDGKTIKMNPFIINQLRKLVKAYLGSLKGINVEEMREFHMKLEFK